MTANDSSEPHTHCPHKTGMMLMTYPPMYKVICCHCGAHGVLVGVTRRPEGHGPYAPESTEYGPDTAKWDQ